MTPYAAVCYKALQHATFQWQLPVLAPAQVNYPPAGRGVGVVAGELKPDLDKKERVPEKVGCVS